MIKVERLTYAYGAAAQPAVSALSFSVKEGEVFGFLGPSGAGKSTTQKILIGLLQGYEGRIFVFGRDLGEWGPAYYERIGVSFEAPNHFLKLTALENLTYFSALYRGPTSPPGELLEMVGLAEDGETTVAHFSKGMKNRLTVARALLHRPPMLFLDEPTAGLDPVNARRIRELIRVQQRQGRTIFLTTHDMNVADELCDRVAFIVDGKIRLIGAPSALRRRYGRATVRVDYQMNGHLIEEEFPLAGLGNDEAFLAILRQHSVHSLHSQEATLEEVFIEVTGRSLS